MSVRKLPAQAERVESGLVQFGEDWPGVFLRGDLAGPSGMILSSVIRSIREGRHPSSLDLWQLEDLATLLNDSTVRRD